MFYTVPYFIFVRKSNVYVFFVCVVFFVVSDNELLSYKHSKGSIYKHIYCVKSISMNHNNLFYTIQRGKRIMQSYIIKDFNTIIKYKDLKNKYCT